MNKTKSFIDGVGKQNSSPTSPSSRSMKTNIYIKKQTNKQTTWLISSNLDRASLVNSVYVFASSWDWFKTLFVSVVIG